MSPGFTPVLLRQGAGPLSVRQDRSGSGARSHPTEVARPRREESELPADQEWQCNLV